MRFKRGTAIQMTGRLSLLPLLLGGLSTVAAQAQITNTWNGQGGTANWSNTTNWNPAAMPTSAATTGLDFTGSAATSNNDLGTFQLNLLQFDVEADLALSGGALNFVSSGGTTPMLTQNTAFTLNISNDLTLTNSLTLNQAGSGTITLAGTLSGVGSLTLAASSGTYTTVLANSGNSYSGGTIITGGTLQLGASNALPTGQDLMVIGSLTDATLDLNGNNATVRNINFADGSVNSVNSTTITDSSTNKTGLLTLNGKIIYNPGANSIGNAITPTAYLNSNVALSSGQHVIDNNDIGNFSVDNYDMIIGGAIKGSGGLDIGSVNDTSTGLFAVLAHANSYTGPTNVITGSLYLGATNALPANDGVTVGNGGSLYLYIANDSFHTETGLKAGSYNQSLGSLADTGGIGGGKVFLGGATLTVGTDNTSTTFSGSILDNDGTSTDPTIVGGSLVKTGTGTLTLSGPSGYSGSTTINAGTLQLGTNDALPDPNNNNYNNLNINLTRATDLILNGGTFDTNNNSQILNNVTNQGGTVYVHGGSSVLTVSGAYSQSGGTTQVDDTLNLTPGQDMNLKGGLLAGAGTIGNVTSSGTVTVTNSGGTLHPGDLLPSETLGTLTITGNYTQQAGGLLQIGLGGGAAGQFDVLAVSNNLSLTGSLDVKLLNGFTPSVGETFDFLTYGGTLNGGFTSVVGLDSGYGYSFSASNGMGILTVTAAVPETSTLFSALLLASAAGIVLRRQRRRNVSSPPAI